MKKKILIPLVIILLVIAAIVPVIVKDIKEKNRIACIKVERKLDYYMYPLRISGEFDVKKDKITIISMEQNEARVKHEVILFNTFYPDYATTYDELMNEFYSYCDNPREIELLEIYRKGRGNIYDEMYGVSYNDYKKMIIAYLEEINVDYETATDEQIEEACKKVAKQLFEEYCDWYEN